MATIERTDVIRLIQQYLKENNLTQTLKCLQAETSVECNVVDSIEAFVNDIIAGNWDVVLKIVKLLKLPDQKLMDLYEQIAIELIELRETRAANWLIHKTEPIIKLKSIAPERYLHLQNLLARSYFDPKEAYRDGSTQQIRRALIADELKKEVSVVPSQRLLTLIGDALKWQKHEGSLPSTTSINIFTGKAHMEQVEEELPPNVLHKHCVQPISNLGCDDDQQDELPISVWCAEFSPDGHYLFIGYSTGLIEARNPLTGRLATDLRYQANKRFIITPSKTGALTLCFSSIRLRDQDGSSRSVNALGVGDKKGDISLWDIEGGRQIRHVKAAHVKCIKCLLMCKNGREILSAGNDGRIKVHGVNSAKTIRDFEAHKPHVNALALSRDDNFIISGGSDAKVKIWNAKTAHLVRECSSLDKIHTLLAMPNFKSDIFLIGDNSEKRCIQLIDLNGNVRTRLSDELEKGEESKSSEPRGKQLTDTSNLVFNAVCSSPKGSWIYAVDKQNINCFNYSTKKVQKRLLANDDESNDLVGVRHHPFLNYVATFDNQGNLKLWAP